MIKVNLLKSKGGGGRPGATQTDIPDGQFDESFEDSFEGSKGGSVFTKVVFILIGCVLLYLYEWYNIDHLTTENAAIQAQVAQINQEISVIEPKIASAKKLQQENEELNKKLSFVKDLGRLRLREIRAIDHLQNIIPEKVWFNTVRFIDKTFEVTGLSATDQDLDRLLEGIRSSPTFIDVLLVRSVDQKTPQGNVKSFVISSGLSREI